MSENKTPVYMGAALDIESLSQRIKDMQEMLKRIFRKNVDYGYLPGMEEKKAREDADFKAGKRKEKSAVKPMLLKPGVEKIDTRYGLYPFYIELPAAELPDNHREVKLICELRTADGRAIAQGVGSCSTYESKYRYRWESTGKPVPKEYWEIRDPELLGGKQYSPRKNYDEKEDKTSWFIFEKIGVADPADVWNTIFKMAAKRAKSDATFSATGASDIFDPEDLEDPDLIPPGDKRREEKQDPKADAKPAPVKIEGNPATAKEPPPDLKLTPEGGIQMDVFDTLEKELADFCEGDTDMMQDRLQALTSFPAMKKDKNGKYTKEPTGEMVPGMKFVSELRMKGKNAWAGSALEKLRKEVAGER